MAGIKNTDAVTARPWPQGLFIQGGKSGLVLARDGQHYLTAFVEVFPEGTFIRGEGTTIAEAEERAWEKYQRGIDCVHEYVAGGYTNGGGLCAVCGQFGSGVFTGEQLGQFCEVCAAGTTWCRWSASAYWDTNRCWPVDPDPAASVWFCSEHAPFREQYEQERQRLSSTVDDDDLRDVLEALTRNP